MTTSDYKAPQDYGTEDGLKPYPHFFAETVGTVKNAPGCWNGVEVAIMQIDAKDGPKKQLGKTFQRNYSTNFDNFAVCQKFGRYFALYSPDYTSTRVMEIVPGIGWEDIGGEERDNDGFCPTGFNIPLAYDMVFEDDAHPADSQIKDWNDKLALYPPGTRYVSLGTHEKAQKIRYEDGQYVRAYTRPNDNPGYEWVWGPKKAWEYGWIIYPPDFGFVSGCYWGDDSSWKIQYLDLTKIESGIIKREEKFGYIELPPNLSLKEAIDSDGCQHMTGLGGRTVGISVQLKFDLDTGNCYVDDKGLYKKIVDGFAHSDTYMEREGWRENWKKADIELKKRWEERHAEFKHLLDGKPY
jgi:hypothetical protein